MVLRALLLDVGGTLWQSKGAYDPRANHITKLSRHYPLDVSRSIENAVSQRFSQPGLHLETSAALQATLLNLSLPARDTDVETVRLCFVHSPLGRRYLTPGCEDLLIACKDRGLRVGLVANSYARLGSEYISDLTALGLSPDAISAIDYSVSSADCGWRKPSPVPLQEALRILGVSPAEACMIGDSESADGAAAEAAAVDFFRFDYRKHKNILDFVTHLDLFEKSEG